MFKKYLHLALISIAVFFFLLSVTALVIYTRIDSLVADQIEKQATLVEGHETLEKWSQPAKDTKFMYTIHMFNVTNPNEVLDGSNPIVKDVGPFEFKQNKTWILEKWHGTKNENKKFLDFRLLRSFYRDSTCVGDLDQNVTILNFPLVSFANLVQTKLLHMPKIIRLIVDFMMKRQLKTYPLFVTRRVGDILFDGYKDSFTDQITRLMKIFETLGFHLDAPSAIGPDGKFSLLNQTNNTDFGLWTINTGLKDLKKVGILEKIDETKENISCWRAPCNTLHGTDGIINHPFVQNTDILPVYEPQLNRTVFLEYERDANYHEIPIKHFVLSKKTYQSPKQNEYNKCFCSNEDDPLNDYNGILKVGRCNFDVPIVFSNPHFYQADNYFGDRIKGFEPDKQKHESFAEVNEVLGLTINGRKTVQLNLDTGALAYYTQKKREIFPVLWLADSGSAGPSTIKDLEDQLYDRVANLKMYSMIALIFFMLISIVAVIYLIVHVTIRRRNDEQEDLEPIVTNVIDSLGINDFDNHSANHAKENKNFQTDDSVLTPQ